MDLIKNQYSPSNLIPINPKITQYFLILTLPNTHQIITPSPLLDYIKLNPLNVKRIFHISIHNELKIIKPFSHPPLLAHSSQYLFIIFPIQISFSPTCDVDATMYARKSFFLYSKSKIRRLFSC